MLEDELCAGKFILRCSKDREIRSGVEFKVCEDSILLLRLNRDDLMPETEIMGTNELRILTTDADAAIWR